MRRSTSISLAIGSLVGGLLSAASTGLAEHRAGAAPVHAANATYVTIDVEGAPSTAALDINSAGDIVGRYPATGTAARGFLRNEAGQFTPIDFPFAEFTVAAGINSRGDIVGQYRLPGQDPNQRHGFLRTRDGTFITIDAPGSRFTNATGAPPVVLPFLNLSNDPEQEYFADGVSDDLTTDLSARSNETLRFHT
jgi:hypothetical protein